MEFTLYKRIDREKRDVYFFSFIYKKAIQNKEPLYIGFFIYKNYGKIRINIISLTQSYINNKYKKIKLDNFNLSLTETIDFLKNEKFFHDQLTNKWFFIHRKYKKYSFTEYVSLLIFNFKNLLITEKIKNYINNS